MLKVFSASYKGHGEMRKSCIQEKSRKFDPDSVVCLRMSVLVNVAVIFAGILSIARVFVHVVKKQCDFMMSKEDRVKTV